ncbi:hypothetical protein MSUIS_05190 [Mycoplasma suis KI3806]|uniref:Uncharacterized protein n=1 Tax=Mycoplasma suis (strain KI_3806) TaxID=708248 RepID=F0V1T1_MYCS3|nr:hypothetical protein MSUIS_05190 [Mycoplasma suis KI3806]
MLIAGGGISAPFLINDWKSPNYSLNFFGKRKEFPPPKQLKIDGDRKDLNLETSRLNLTQADFQHQTNLEIELENKELDFSLDNFQGNPFSSFEVIEQKEEKNIQNISQEIKKEVKTIEIGEQTVEKKEKISEEVKEYNDNYKSTLYKVGNSIKRMIAAKRLKEQNPTWNISYGRNIDLLTWQERKSVQEFYKGFCDSLESKEKLSKQLEEVSEGSSPFLKNSSQCKEVLSTLNEIGWPEQNLKVSDFLLGEKVQKLMKVRYDYLTQREIQIKNRPTKRACFVFISSRNSCLSEESDLEREKENFLKILVLKVTIRLLQDMDQMKMLGLNKN